MSNTQHTTRYRLNTDTNQDQDTNQDPNQDQDPIRRRIEDAIARAQFDRSVYSREAADSKLKADMLDEQIVVLEKLLTTEPEFSRGKTTPAPAAVNTGPGHELTTTQQHSLASVTGLPAAVITQWCEGHPVTPSQRRLILGFGANGTPDLAPTAVGPVIAVPGNYGRDRS